MQVYLVFVITVIVIYKTSSSFGVLENRFVGPPLSQIAIAIVLSTAIVETMCQFVPKYRTDSAII